MSIEVNPGIDFDRSGTHRPFGPRPIPMRAGGCARVFVIGGDVQVRLPPDRRGLCVLSALRPAIARESASDSAGSVVWVGLLPI